MEELSIVRKRSRFWPVLFVFILLAIAVLAALYVIGSGGVTGLTGAGFNLGLHTQTPQAGGVYGAA